MSMTEIIPAFYVIAVLCALSFILNGTFLIVICKNWTLVKRRRITYHLTNLAMSDCLLGGSGFCVNITAVVARNATTLKSVLTSISVIGFLTSLLAVCLMAIERALCIKKPLTWNEIFTLKRIITIMVGNWVLALTLAILLYFYTLQIKITIFILCHIPIFVTSLVYISIYLKISKSNEVDDEAQHSFSTGERLNKLMKRKFGNLVLILSLVLVITMMPSLLCSAVQFTCELSVNCKFIETANTIATYTYLLATIHFVVNPILYAWRIRLYQQAFWKMLGRGRRADNEN